MFSLQHISTGTAVALAVGAFAAPAASAMPIGGYSRPDKQLSPAPVTTAAPIGGYSRQDKQLSPNTALGSHAGLGGVAASRPAMISPRPVLPPWASSGAVAFHAVSSPGSPAVRATGPGDGFDWAYAGIGAAGFVAIVAIGGGLVLVERRPRRTKTTAVATG